MDTVMSINTKLKAIALGSTLLVSSCAFGENNSTNKVLDNNKTLSYGSYEYKSTGFNSLTENQIYPIFCACLDIKKDKGTDEKINGNFGFSVYAETKYNFDIFTKVQFANKQTVNNQDTNKTSTETTQSANLGLFVPLSYGKTTLFGETYNSKWGLIGEVDTILSSGDFTGTKSYYTGLRYATRPNTYFDVMYGKTGILDRRIKFKGEYKVKDEKAIIGFEYNTQIENTDKIALENKDNFRIYLKLPINFSKLRGFFDD
jgi:hypothetical protein